MAFLAGPKDVTIVQHRRLDGAWELEIMIGRKTYQRQPLKVKLNVGRNTPYFEVMTWKSVPTDLQRVYLDLAVIVPKNGPEPYHRSPVQVHRIVAGLGYWKRLWDDEADDKLEVHHKNYDGLDNRIDNLEPLTDREHNLRHRNDGAVRKVTMLDYHAGIGPNDKADLVAEALFQLERVDNSDGFFNQPDYGELYESPTDQSLTDLAEHNAWAALLEQAQQRNASEFCHNFVDYSLGEAITRHLLWAGAAA